MEQREFPWLGPDLPDGMSYRAAFLEATEEEQLLRQMTTLPFCEARHREWTARRRIVSLGRDAAPLPAFLHSLRDRLAAWTGVPAAEFRQALINEYRPGTPLGWHRDAPLYEIVAGISLGAIGRMRLRPYVPHQDGGSAVCMLDLPARSAYVLRGVARWNWQHAISPPKTLRYSITFRTLAENRRMRVAEVPQGDAAERH